MLRGIGVRLNRDLVVVKDLTESGRNDGGRDAVTRKGDVQVHMNEGERKGINSSKWLNQSGREEVSFNSRELGMKHSHIRTCSLRQSY